MVALVQAVSSLALPVPVVTIPGHSGYAYGLQFWPPERRIVPRHACPVSDDQKLVPRGMNHNRLPITLATGGDFDAIDIRGLSESLPWGIGHKYSKLAAAGVIGNLRQGFSERPIGVAQPGGAVPFPSIGQNI